MCEFSVSCVSLSTVATTSYDLVLFCSGYEQRCTNAPSKLERLSADDIVVLGFSRLAGTDERRHSDEYFATSWNVTHVSCDYDDDGQVYEVLQRIAKPEMKQIRILVDYSSMSRTWYAAVANWARVVSENCTVTVDFMYSVGVYPEELTPIFVDSIGVMAACEGGPPRFEKAVSILGLGFYQEMAQTVLEHLQPDSKYVYWADPGATKTYAQRVTGANQFLIDSADGRLRVPFHDVEGTLRGLTELALPHLPHSEVVCVPLGPKPHVLATVLLCLRFPYISCLRVSAHREKPEHVASTGEIVVTRVEFGS